MRPKKCLRFRLRHPTHKTRNPPVDGRPALDARGGGGGGARPPVLFLAVAVLVRLGAGVGGSELVAAGGAFRLPEPDPEALACTVCAIAYQWYMLPIV